MKERKAKRHCFWNLYSNRGSTLIEVIVCVLIIGVAFVPLMAGLTASMRANRDTENRLYAENVASNIVEICKAFGKKGIDNLKDLNYDTENGIKAFLAGDSVSLTKMGENNFKITNIASGKEGKNFWANIEFDNSKYDEYLKNEDGNYIDKDGKVVIEDGITHQFSYEDGTPIAADPRVPLQNNFTGYQTIAGLTDAVVISFKEDDLGTIVNKFYDQLKNQEGFSLTVDQMKDSVSMWLRRSISLETREITVDGKTRYEVVGSIKYIAKNDTNVIKNSLIESVVYQTQPYEEMVINYNSGPDIKYSNASANSNKNYGIPPKSIIVAYSDLKNETGDYIDFLPSSVGYDMEINKNTAGKMNVYCICNDAAQLIAQSHKLRINVTGTEVDGTTPIEEGSGGEHFYYVSAYCNLNGEGDYQNCNKLDSFGEGSSGMQSKINDVKVTIWEYEGNSESTKKVLEKESTVIEFE